MEEVLAILSQASKLKVATNQIKYYSDRIKSGKYPADIASDMRHLAIWRKALSTFKANKPLPEEVGDELLRYLFFSLTEKKLITSEEEYRLNELYPDPDCIQFSSG
jgi:hypothetical protein